MTVRLNWLRSFLATLMAGLVLLACSSDGGEEGDDDDGGADTGADGPRPDVPILIEEFPPPGAALVFAAIGDYGDTSDIDDGETDTLLVANLIKSWAPAFIVTVGDNDYSDAEFEGTFEGLELGVGQYFHEYIGNYRGSEGAGAAENAFFPIPGDHDYGDDCDNPRLGDYLDYFTLPVGESDETYYSIRRGDVEIFLLDSIVECHQDAGAKWARERAWLEAAATASDAPFKIVLVHNPPYSSGANHGSAEHTQWPYADWGIQLVLAGDDHIYERVERDGVTYLVIGLGGVDIHPIGTPVEGSQIRYNANLGALGLAILDGALLVAFVDVDGEIIDQFTLGAEGEGGPLDPNVPPVTQGDWYRPGVDTSWQWQLQGQLNQSYDVGVYDIDLADTSEATIDALQAAGRRVICYFSAGSFEDFRDDAGEFEEADLGATLEGFADERWLDIRSENVHRIMRARLDVAAAKGCDGVEPDNMDGYANETGLPLTPTDQLAFNRFIANEAHRRGLTVGLKNDLDQIEDLVAYYDFALNEQCHEFDECELLAPFVTAGKAVFVAEYDSRYVNNEGTRASMCADSRAADLRVLVLPLDLDDSFRISCDE